MTPSGDNARSRSWLPWSGMTQVEIVDLYTRQSLYLIFVLTSALFLAGSGPQVETEFLVPMLVGGAVVIGLGVWAMSAVYDQYPTPWPLPRPAFVLLGGGLLYAALALIAWPVDPRTSALAVVIMAVAISIGSLPDNRISAAVIGGGAVLGVLNDLSWESVGAGLFLSILFVFTGRASMWLFGIVRDLDDARQAQSELAVMEERLRFSRDVHDVLGRRLSTIAVQAELAATLAQRGDDRAPERMLEVREIAHQALREARELARGYRATDFRQELDGARSLLRSAGIDVQLAVDDLPLGWEEPAGWVVREAVTNILRHSAATTVEVTFDDGALRVSNDGVRAAPAGADAGDGTGLQSLRERLAPLGSTLTAEPADGGGWMVVAAFPNAGPLSAKAAAGGVA